MEIKELNEVRLDTNVVTVSSSNDLTDSMYDKLDMSSVVHYINDPEEDSVISSIRVQAETVDIGGGEDDCGSMFMHIKKNDMGYSHYPPICWTASASEVSSGSRDVEYAINLTPQGYNVDSVDKTGKTRRTAAVNIPRAFGTLVVDSMLSCDPISGMIESIVNKRISDLSGAIVAAAKA